ncbi:uncharacterized protein LOC106631644 isoform X1 [Falco cherrug]|uniref:uncharacterized protein LOC106631644 isoform X1 n=1 Tax=Falco cherrug TaxID=345164 RepID=UPI00247932EE|nr:uncharacterized protein LOC106631644 isoform X1 [Falco cherrug]
MEVQLASGFLPLLLLAWLPAGLSHQISATIDVSVGLDLILQCLLQAGSNSTARGVKWFNTTQNNGEKQNEDGVEMKNGSAQLVFPSVNKAHSGMYTCRMENMRNTSRNKDSKLNTHGTVASQPRESVITTECRFKIWSENLTVHVKWYRPAGLEVGNQTDTIVLGENCANLTSPGMHAASTGICGCRVFITRVNLTDTGNGTQGTVPSCSPGAPQAKGTWIETWAGLNFPLCIIFSLAAATLLYMLVIGLLVWRCRRNRKGKAEPALSLRLLWELVSISSSPAGLDKPRLGRCPSLISCCSCSLGVPCTGLSRTNCPGVGRRFTPPFLLASCWLRACSWHKLWCK